MTARLAGTSATFPVYSILVLQGGNNRDRILPQPHRPIAFGSERPGTPFAKRRERVSMAVAGPGWSGGADGGSSGADDAAARQ